MDSEEERCWDWSLHALVLRDDHDAIRQACKAAGVRSVEMHPMHAEGRSTAFEAIAAAYANGPVLLRHNLWLENLERVLEGKQKLIVPSGTRDGAIAVWQDMPKTNMPPMAMNSIGTSRRKVCFLAYMMPKRAAAPRMKVICDIWLPRMSPTAIPLTSAPPCILSPE